MTDEPLSFDQAEALGVSREAYDELIDIVGHMPTADEVSTLLAMWDSNGRQQSLYGWLRGQHHAVQRDDYLYTGNAEHRALREPHIRDCVDAARRLCQTIATQSTASPIPTGMLLYMVGNINTEFADSEYARLCLHLIDDAMASTGTNDDCDYLRLILDALTACDLCCPAVQVATGGLFCTLLSLTAPRGFDILSPREVRIDAFLFGEEQGRFITAINEKNENTFLLKMDEARLNCCFLGRTTKNRIVVDGYDFGPTSRYIIA